MIKSHKELAAYIENKSILHLNSLGKDSVVSLEWLVNYANPRKIVSLFFEFIASHPSDSDYLDYLKNRYPSVHFITEPNSIELNLIVSGDYQSPIEILKEYNHYEYDTFERKKQIAEIECDFICSGVSKYESFARASKFHRQGILIGKEIFPLGMMSKAQVYSIIHNSGLKLHPQYKFTNSTYDHPSYWKMRSSLLTNEQFKENIFKTYPLLELDKFRHERLF